MPTPRPTPGTASPKTHTTGVRCRIESGERGEECVRVGRAVEREPASEVHLVALAGCEERVDASDEHRVLVGGQTRGRPTQLDRR